MKKASRSVVLVFVTDQPNCKRLIEAGAQLAREYQVPLQVLSICSPTPLSAHAASRLQVLRDLSAKRGADMTVLFQDDPILAAAVYAKKCNAMHIVSGSPGERSTLFIEGVRQLCPSIPWSVVDEEERLFTFPPIETVNQN